MLESDEFNLLKSENEELKARLSQQDQTILQLENEISSAEDGSAQSCSKKVTNNAASSSTGKNMKSVHFYVQRMSNFDSVFGAIPFESAPVNEGNAFDLSSGIFTAPVKGIYHFQFSSAFKSTTPPSNTLVGLEMNGKSVVDFGKHDSIFVMTVAAGKLWESVSFSAPIPLEAGYTVNLVNWGSSGGLEDTSNNPYYTHFSGWLIEEKSTGLHFVSKY